jgi:hypothetical protein
MEAGEAQIDPAVVTRREDTPNVSRFYGDVHQMSSMTDLANKITHAVGSTVQLRPIDSSTTISTAESDLGDAEASARRAETRLAASEAEERRLAAESKKHRLKTSRNLRQDSSLSLHERRLTMLQDSSLQSLADQIAKASENSEGLRAKLDEKLEMVERARHRRIKALRRLSHVYDKSGGCLHGGGFGRVVEINSSDDSVRVKAADGSTSWYDAEDLLSIDDSEDMVIGSEKSSKASKNEKKGTKKQRQPQQQQRLGSALAMMTPPMSAPPQGLKPPRPPMTSSITLD